MGQTDGVVQLLADGVSVAARDTHGRTALHWAVREGHAATAGALLDAGANMAAEDKETWTPLFFAARHGQASMVTLLLRRGARADAIAASGNTALHNAAIGGHVECASVLLLAAPGCLSVRNREGRTPLELAAVWSWHGVAKVLLDAGADVNEANEGGRTPLHSAVQGSEEMVRTLLDGGADVAKKDVGGRTALHCCGVLRGREGRANVTRMLLNAGADVTARDEQGLTAEDIARSVDQDEVAALLLEWRTSPSPWGCIRGSGGSSGAWCFRFWEKIWCSWCWTRWTGEIGDSLPNNQRQHRTCP
eukprot:CAMPEP_0180402996 /NCGR_PEP_ID=MMETSP0989-20121125/39185_1 /TAXON_ID=697907 /ORGANISM="non described non described, Strain CCMP2293" /LENGTH=304 /DNA_ID=CAMNT_0022406193 /DNA_START=24 /DNA_END=935 /DNA_ORIENTATION=-